MTSEDIGFAQALYRGAMDKKAQIKINCELFAVTRDKMIDILGIDEDNITVIKKEKREIKRVPEVIKKKAIERYFEVNSYKQVAKEFGFNDTTIRNWVVAFKKRS